MIDPNDIKSGTQVLTSLIGLIMHFKKERSSRTDATYREFTDWLDYHRHEDIKNAIAGTQAIQEEVNKLLRDDNAQMLAKLDSINGVVTQILSKMTGFEVLAQQLGNGAADELSPQALSILYLFSRTTATQFAYIDSNNVIVFDPTGEAMQVQEPKYILDDIAILQLYGFIKLAGHHREHTFYSLTRNGAKYVSVMNFQPIIRDIPTQ